MFIEGISVVVTGGGGGLGAAAARRLAGSGARVVIADLPASPGQAVADEVGGTFVPTDVLSDDDLAAAFDAAEQSGPLRAIVHTPGRGKAMRVVDNDGNPASRADYEEIVALNLVGTFNTLRLGAARMCRNEPVDGERGAVVMTASVAAFEGQVGQAAYTSSKAGIVGLTLCAARDLSRHLVRVNTIAPGIFDTPAAGPTPPAGARQPRRVRPAPRAARQPGRVRPAGRAADRQRLPQRRDHPPRRRNPDGPPLTRPCVITAAAARGFAHNDADR